MTVQRSAAAAGLLAATALVLTACGGPAAVNSATAPAETIPFTWERNVAGEGEDPVLETTTVDVPRNPETIVSFDMASLDTIGGLGGEVAGAPLDFVPEYLSDYLSDDAFSSGDLFEADLVEIEAHQPDLIIIAGRSSGLYEELSQIAPTIDLSPTGTYLETLATNTTFLGEVLGAEDEASAAVAELEAQITEVREKTPELGTGLGVLVSGGSLSAMAPAGQNPDGPTYRSGILYDVFGVEPVLADIETATHGEPISFEFVLENNPDHLWVIDRDQATGEEAKPAAEVLDNAIINETAAAQAEAITYLDPVAWYIVYGGLETTQIMIDDVKSALS